MKLLIINHNRMHEIPLGTLTVAWMSAMNSGVFNPTPRLSNSEITRHFKLYLWTNPCMTKIMPSPCYPSQVVYDSALAFRDHLQMIIWILTREKSGLDCKREHRHTGADLGGGCRGCAPSLRWPAVFLYNWYSAKKQNKKTMWFIGVEVEQETSAPPPKKNPGSAPEPE